jgi:DNA-binding SARP family transcriptional activator/tetratricopeptide (TPR) repeat protein
MTERMPGLSVRLFGNFSLEVDGRPFVMATPRRTLPILAYLLLNRGATVSREFLSYLMWPDESEESARSKLRANLFELARVLPPADGARWIVADGDNVFWNPEAALNVDVDEFETLCADPSRLEEGVALYRGDLLESLYDEWIFAPRERYRNLYLTALTGLISEARRNRDFPRAIARAQQLLSVDPWREDVVRRLIAIRYESGDRTGALVEYQRFADRLHAELEIGPMPETLALRDAIARDAAIDPEPAPRSVAVVSAVTAPPSLPFVGRELEFGLLSEAWSRAARGNGGALFIGGESGIGKSRLALEFAHRVEELGGRVLSGSTGMPEAMPYQGLVEALRSALPLVASLRVRDAWLASVATLVPELRAHLPALPELSRIATTGERTRLFESLAGTLAALAQPRPLALIIEDVHWAEEATSAALRFLLGRLSTLRVLLVLTYRDDELPPAHPLSRVFRDAVIAGHGAGLTLRALGLNDVENLVRALPQPLERSAQQLHASSDGNPLFLAQLVEGDGTAGAGATESVRSLVSRRLDGLSPQTRTLAEIAALVGTQFSREVVRRVSGWDGAATDDALDELIERRIVREASGRGFFDYAFAHHLVQQTVAESAQTGRAAARHRRIARALDELYPERAAELAPRIARHYALAGDGASAAPRYLAAARQALALGALDEASSHVARGLELADSSSVRVDLLLVDETLAARRLAYDARLRILDELDALTATLGDEDGRRTALLRRAAFANERKDPTREAAALDELRRLVTSADDAIWLGRLYNAEAQHFSESDDIETAQARSEAAVAAFAAAGAHAEEAEARRRLADIVTLRGDTARAVTLFEEARVAGENAHDATLSFRALKGLYQLAFYRGDSQRCFEISRELLDLGFASGDRRTEAEGHHSMANALNFLRVRRAEAREHLRVAEQIFEELGEHVDTARSLVMTAMHQCATGDTAGARAACARAMQLYALHPPPARLKITALLTYGISEILSGDGVAGKAYVLEALELSRAMGFRLLEAAALGNLADAEAANGEYAAAIDSLERSLETWGQTEAAERNRGIHSSQLALWLAALGDLAAAREHARRALEREATFDKISFWPQACYWSLAQAFRACGDAAEAASALDKAYTLTRAGLEDLDAAEREHFLSLPWHRDLIPAFERDEWPNPPR